MKQKNIFLIFLLSILFAVQTILSISGCSDNDDGNTTDNIVDDDTIDDDDAAADDDTTIGDDATIDDDTTENDDTAADDDSAVDDDTAEPSYIPLTDEAGRTIILHGANFMPIENSGQPLDYQRMTEWGFNVVRIVITWQGLEPEQGVYDENYLPNIVEPQVQYAYDEGIKVVLNMHQYHWSKCCNGMGMPEWTCADLSDSPLEWLWQSGLFWNHPEYVDGFVAAWDHVAEYFSGDDRVFAYDLFNEPIAGLRTLPWFMDNQLLRPLYERLIATIRAVHPEPYLFIEPPMITLAGFPFTMEPIEAERMIYSPHLYPGTISEGGGYTFPKTWIERHLNRRQKESIKQGFPLLIGETGLSSSVDNAELYARDAVDLLEAKMAHWTWWTFHYDDDGMGLCDASGRPKEIFYRHLARPYPQVVAGVLQSFHFDTDSRIFTVDFDNREELSPGVEIFVNSGYYYPAGFVVRSSDEDGAWDYDFDEITWKLTVECNPEATSHTITIEPIAN